MSCRIPHHQLVTFVALGRSHVKYSPFSLGAGPAIGLRWRAVLFADLSCVDQSLPGGRMLSHAHLMSLVWAMVRVRAVDGRPTLRASLRIWD